MYLPPWCNIATRGFWTTSGSCLQRKSVSWSFTIQLKESIFQNNTGTQTFIALYCFSLRRNIFRGILNAYFFTRYNEIFMHIFQSYLEEIADEKHQKKMETLLTWVHETFPTLGMRIAWSQPMFTDHETFIIGFSRAKAHISVASESKSIEKFSDDLSKAKLSATKELFRITWEQEIPYSILERIIRFNIEDKKECSIFWRK